ncbi:PEP-CTERM sorting domain-containing protein [Chloroflexi bacterium TSY]|nr:PEP-CTERM sorting domain-containing protein [Chloroflexi bacterium TSY]
MTGSLFKKVLFGAIIVLFLGFAVVPTLFVSDIVYAQDSDLTRTPEPTTPPPTATTVVNQEPIEPKEIPEPITVVLFGAGLAALSASVAVNRKKKE